MTKIIYPQILNTHQHNTTCVKSFQQNRQKHIEAVCPYLFSTRTCNGSTKKKTVKSPNLHTKKVATPRLEEEAKTGGRFARFSALLPYGEIRLCFFFSHRFSCDSAKEPWPWPKEKRDCTTNLESKMISKTRNFGDLYRWSDWSRVFWPYLTRKSLIITAYYGNKRSRKEFFWRVAEFSENSERKGEEINRMTDIIASMNSDESSDLELACPSLERSEAPRVLVLFKVDEESENTGNDN